MCMPFHCLSMSSHSSFQLYNQSGDVSLVRSGVGGYRSGSPLVAGQLVQGDQYPTSALPVLV